MTLSDSEPEDDLFDNDEQEEEADVEDDAVEEATEEGDSGSDASETEDGSGEESDEDGEPSSPPASNIPDGQSVNATTKSSPSVETDEKATNKPAETRQRPKAYAVDVVCGIPHPCPTHTIAASHNFSHLLTGSDDGYIRDYDLFGSLNGKTYLTATQRQHCGIGGVVDGQMKAGLLRCWWETRDFSSMEKNHTAEVVHQPLTACYSLVVHSQALWALAGMASGQISLFTVRHEPGTLYHLMFGHKGPISALALAHDEKHLLSGSWDGDTFQWDLDTGQVVQRYPGHGAQLCTVAVRPEMSSSMYSPLRSPIDLKADDENMAVDGANQTEEAKADARSDASFDDLFDGPNQDADADAEGEQDDEMGNLSMPGQQSTAPTRTSRKPNYIQRGPPLLSSSTYSSFSPSTLMTASVDGQVTIWDQRSSDLRGVGRLWTHPNTPPWCVSACWSTDGSQIFVGRRKGTIDIYDMRQAGESTRPHQNPRILQTLRNPASSGPVSCVVPFPDGKHLACASNDNIRLWNAAEAAEASNDASGKNKGGTHFKIIPGHHGGLISQMLIDSEGRFLVSASSNRGWSGESTRAVFVHEIKNVL